MKKIILLSFLSLLLLTDFQLSAQAPYESDEVYGSLEWRNIGPFRGGRSCAVTGVPNMPNLFYFGAAGGGIWKTTDGGRAWENISQLAFFW